MVFSIGEGKFYPHFFSKKITKMKILVFDTETTGLPESWEADPQMFPEFQPYPVQVCAHIYDLESQNLINKFCEIVTPHKYHIPPNMVHGISHEKAMCDGVNIKHILSEFREFCTISDIHIAHNYQFDYGIMTAAFARIGQETPLKKQFFCTMKNTSHIVGIKHGRNYKYPKLSELYYYLFNETLEGAHDAQNDVIATAKCFFELKKRYKSI